eukprot:8090928-Karenia_brevis.AAC.1
MGHKKTDCWHDVKNGGSGAPPPPKKHKEPRPKAGAKAEAKTFNGECNYCKVKGHREKDCRKKKADEASENAANEGSTKRKISSLEAGELAKFMKEALTKAISSLSEGYASSSGQKHVGTLSVSSVGNTVDRS